MSGELLTSTKDGHVLTFDTRDKKHIYHLDGVVVPGVTTINKKGFPTPQRLINWMMSKGKNASKIANEAADVGKIVHRYAELTAKGIPKAFDWDSVEGHKDEDKIRNCITKFDLWYSTNHKKTVDAEVLVGSIEYKYGGMIDRLSLDETLGKGIEDFKTSNYFFVEQLVQQAGYRLAAKEWLGLDIDWLRIVKFPKEGDRIDTLTVTKDGWLLNDELIQSAPTVMGDLTEQFIRNRKTSVFVDVHEELFDGIYEKTKGHK